MKIETHLPFVEDLLSRWQSAIGPDYPGYKNHVYRMIHFCFALHDCDLEARQKLMIAGCFHDIGIWTDDTFAYLPPSAALAQAYLQQNGLDTWIPEIVLMIEMHHKLRPYRDPSSPLVEIFRQGDLVDFSLGVIKFGLPERYIRQVKEQFPNAGFHKRLVQLETGWLARHPWNPLPVFKW